MNSVKVCITIPREEFIFIETERKKTKLKRSQIIQEIISSFYKNRWKQYLVKKYINGYKHQPETQKEIESLEKVQLDTLNEGDF